MTSYKLVIDNYKGTLYNTNICMSAALWGISGNARESPMPLQISLNVTVSGKTRHVANSMEVSLAVKNLISSTLEPTYRHISDLSRTSLRRFVCDPTINKKLCMCIAFLYTTRELTEPPPGRREYPKLSPEGIP